MALCPKPSAWVALVGAALLVHCGGPVGPSVDQSSSAVQSSAVQSLTLDGPTVLIAIGQTSQFAAIATLANGTTVNVSTEATWQSSAPTVAAVSQTGLVTVRSFGHTDITAEYHNTRGSVTVLAIPPPSPGST